MSQNRLQWQGNPGNWNILEEETMNDQVIFDVAVIGGSIAGSTAAHLLSRQGLRVALFEKATFPRRKPCGEGLAATAIERLKRFDLWPSLGAIRAYPFYGFAISNATHHERLMSRTPLGVSIVRSEFDNALLSRACSNELVSFMGASAVREVHEADDRVSLTTEHGTVLARYCIIADGGGSRCASKLGITTTRTGPVRVGVTTTFRGRFEQPTNMVHIGVHRDYETYCTPLGDDLNLTVLAPFRSQVNPRRLIDDPLFLERVFQSVGFSGEMLLAPLGRAPVGSATRRCYSTRTLLIGDAAEEFDPIGGMGMTHAVLSAELAADALTQVLLHGRPATTAFQTYAMKRRQAAAPLRGFTSLWMGLSTSSRKYPVLIKVAATPVARLCAGALHGGLHSIAHRSAAACLALCGLSPFGGAL